MKLPRFLLWSMLSLSVVAVLAAAGWWWVTWPQRTLRVFAQLISAGEFEETNDLIVQPKTPGPARDTMLSGTVLQRRLADDLEVDQPSLVEFIKGRRVINGLFGRGAGGGVIVVVEYGRIRVTDNLGNTYGLVVVRRNDK
jgi:hypothetical protein